ncbi:MAG: ATP-binding cassette domain-containing protein, partial [Nitrospira sp.]|nr:ATP-binding cassette domain-containing protein [Nitrospira sp.]
RARTSVKVLSGGERNRLFLARLFTQPSNVLVMDEPTNDLDIETLELLEELLIEYSGTLLLVSHDRAFLNNVVTSTIVLEGDGMVAEYPGGYDDWLSQRKIVVKELQTKTKDHSEENFVQKEKSSPRKLSFKEEKELASLPAKIEQLESSREELFTLMSGAEFFKKTPDEISETKTKLATIETELVSVYERWEYLEKLRENPL